MGVAWNGCTACREARSCRSCTRVGGRSAPVRWYFLIAWRKSLIEAMSNSDVSGGGGVTAVSGNQATVSVMRVADVSVTYT